MASFDMKSFANNVQPSVGLEFSSLYCGAVGGLNRYRDKIDVIVFY